MAAVMIGVDPHKGSHTAVAIGAAEEPLGKLRVRASAAQAERLVAWAAAWPERTWAVEGAGGLGHLLAQQLVAAGERLGAEAGMPLTHLATAFLRSHPAVTAVLIGPRKPDQLDDLLAGADVELSEDVLDRIDEIVPPGTEINPADNYLAASPAIEDKRLRRR